MKRMFLLFRWLVIVAGLAITGLIIYSQRDTRAVFTSTIEWETKGRPQFVQMNPQSEHEFWRDWNKVLELRAQHWSPTMPRGRRDGMEEIYDALTTYSTGGGRYPPTRHVKPWATAELRMWAFSAYQSAGMSGYFDRFWNDPNHQDKTDAYVAWVHRPLQFWAKLLASLGAGGGFILLGLLFLPYVCFIGLCVVLMAGKVFPTAGWVTPRPSITQSVAGGDGHHQSDAPAAVVDELSSAWSVVLVILAMVIVRDTRRHWRTIRTMSTRAPPFLKGDLAMRLIMSGLCGLLLCCLPFTANAWTNTAGLTAGEWSFGRGTLLSWTSESGQLLLSPTAMADGSAIDLFGRYDLLPSSSATLAVGTSVGSLVAADGLHPYLGPSIKIGVSGYGFDLVGGGFFYHTRQFRLADMGLLDLSWTKGSATVGAAFQPVRYQGAGWIHRVAGHAAYKFRAATITVEARVETNNGQRTSMHVDLSVPVPLKK